MDRLRLARRIAPLLLIRRSQLVVRSSSSFNISKPLVQSPRAWEPSKYASFPRILTRGFAGGGASGDIVIPFMGDSVPDGTIAQFLKQPGDAIQVDDVIAQIETDKVTLDVRSETSGTLKELTAKVGDTVTPGTKIGFVAVGDTSGKPAAEKSAPAEKPAPEKPAPTSPKPAQKAEVKPAPAAPKPPTSPEQAPSPSGEEKVRKVAMTRLRKRVATRLKDSQNTFAMLTTFNEIDMTNLMALRAKYKDDFQAKHGAKLGFMSAFVKATVSALKEQPVVNAVIEGDNILYRDFIDISVAVGTPKGLVVPVVRGVDAMSFADVEKTISMLGKRANEGLISIDDMAGGTFTISNGGVYGSLLSTPIINPPQSAILGMHSIQKRPVVIGNDIVARPMMYVALTYDHRLIDGREAVLFLRHIKDVIEDPSRLLLDV